MVNHWQPGIRLWTVGDRSSETFKRLWLTIQCWQSFWYVSDGYPVYPCFIQPEDHLVSKTYMTRAVRKLEVTSSCAPSACLSQVEGENTRLRHYLARLPSWARASIERLCVTQNQLKCSNIQFVSYSTILSSKLFQRSPKSLLIQQRHSGN